VTAALPVPPPNYDTFAAPPAGQSYTDPAFATQITRVTDARSNQDAGPRGWIGTEYPTVDAFNCDCTYFLVVAVDHFQLYSAAGFMQDLLEISASSEPRWSRTNPGLIYFHDATGIGANVLQSLNVLTGKNVVVKAFPAYSAIRVGNGEGDISEDGSRLVLIGDNRYAFEYLIDHGLMPGYIVGAVDSAACSPDNNMLVSAADIQMYSSAGIPVRQVTRANGHKDTCRDLDGREIVVWTNSNDPDPIASCANGIVKIDLATGVETCLLSLDWSLAVHISAPAQAGFVIVETYADPAKVTPGAAWPAYANELLKVQLDGSAVTRICHHRSRCWAGHETAQPKATVSADGSLLLFSSNMANPNPTVPDYCDVYSIELTHPAPRTVEERLTALESQVAALEARG
jgi:hypothetical protein